MWNIPGSKEEVIKGVILITGGIAAEMSLEEMIVEGTGTFGVVITSGGIIIIGTGLVEADRTEEGAGLTGGEEGDTSEATSEEDFSFFILRRS